MTAPNVVSIDARLVTSGQPSAQALGELGAEGFEAVIYLAPSSVSDAVADEPRILAKQGIEWVHLPLSLLARQQRLTSKPCRPP